MALTKVINDLADLNQSGSTNALKGCAGTTAEQPASSSSIEYLIVGGGGGGATNGSATGDGLGGGGAGGYVTGSTTVYHGTPTILTVGDGGNGGTTTNGYEGINGNDSGFNGIRAIGGGGGGAGSAPGLDGGSGGGGGRNADPAYHSIYYGSALDNQGNNGGSGGWTPGSYQASTGAGGGGSGEPFLNTNGTGGNGANSSSGAGGSGGSGTNINAFINSTNAALAQIGDISGSDVYIAGGGGGGAYSGTKGTGGSGGGGTGGQSGTNATSGTDNTGGGGGGDGSASSLGADGGSGVSVIKYDNTIVTGYTLNSEDTYTVNWPADKYGAVYYPLNLDVKDVGGYYDGTATDITYTNGQFNQAASFNGSSSYITLPNSVEVYKGTGKFAISAWFKTDTIPGTEQMLYCTFETAYLFIKLKASGVIEGQVAEASTGTGRVCETPTGTISTDVWYHVVFTGDTNDLRLYIDGTLSDSESTWNGTFYTSSAGCSIGSRNVGTNQFWDGEIEQVRIYSGPLTTSDVQDIYNNSKPGSLPPLKTSSDLTTTICNFPSGVTGSALYQFNADATDTCGSYDGTNDSGIVYVPGVFGNCAQFGGGADRIDIDEALLGSGTTKIWSTSMWIKTSQTGYEQQINNTAAAWSQAGYAVYCNPNGYLRFQTSGAASYSGYLSLEDRTLFDGQWHHIVATYSSAGGTNDAYMYLYVDGVNITDLCTAYNSWTQGGGATYNTFTVPRITLGNWADSSSYPGGLYPFVGEMDQVRFFNTALTDQNVYDLWQKENDIQTYFPDTPTSGTDTLVFKEGSGEITFKNDTPPGAEIGMLRHNNTLGQMEHFNSGGWKDFTNCTNSVCSYPVSGSALYQFNNNSNDTCGNYNATAGANITYVPSGNFGKAANFPGNLSTPGDGIILPSSLSTLLSNNYSISIWFNADDFATGCISGCGNYPTLIAGFDTVQMYFCVNPTPVLRYYSYGAGTGLNGTTTLSTNTWYHTVLTQSSTDGAKIYLNGVLESSDSSMTANAATAGSGQNLLGGYNSSGSFDLPWDGLMDQIRIYNSVLTPTQVTQLYNEIYCP